MKCIKQYAAFVGFSLLLVNTSIKAQEINGDTICVDAKTEVALRFPSRPTNYYTNPPDAQYNLITLPKGFTIRAKKKNTAPADLIVIENGRTHKFVIVYKQPDANSIKVSDYDFSTVKKIKERLKQLENQEKKYNDAIAAADKLYNEEKYEEAKTLYTNALNIYKKPWPKDQILKINKELKKQKRKKN